MKEISGPGAGTSPVKPSCHTSTVRPKAPPTESRKPKPATSGTKMERKTASSRKMARPTTMARYGPMASSRRSVMSSCTAVRPVMPISAPVASSSSAPAVRRAEAVPTVASSVGAVVGLTMICADFMSLLTPTSWACLTPPT